MGGGAIVKGELGLFKCSVSENGMESSHACNRRSIGFVTVSSVSSSD